MSSTKKGDDFDEVGLILTENIMCKAMQAQKPSSFKNLVHITICNFKLCNVVVQDA